MPGLGDAKAVIAGCLGRDGSRLDVERVVGDVGGSVDLHSGVPLR